MRVLCVGRHAFLSEHLCRFFAGAGAECEPAVGPLDALRAASRFEPHIVVSDCDLLTPALLDSWTREPALADVPVLAVSLTRRPLDPSADPSGTGIVYLPTLGREQAATLLGSMYRPRGLSTPPGWSVSTAVSSARVV